MVTTTETGSLKSHHFISPSTQPGLTAELK